LEYYDDSLKLEGVRRSFAYRWPGDYAVGAMSIRVMQPVDATDMSTTPTMGGTSTDDQGFVYLTSDAGSLGQGETFDLNLEYRKATDTLSATTLNVEPSAPVGGVSSTQRTVNEILPYVLGLLGLALIIGAGVWWYWQSGLGKTQKSASRHRKRKLVITADESIPAGTTYCHHCGKRASGGDRFCRTCGTKLRY
jgi:hypothetical protein